MENVEEILEKWNRTKREISTLEKKADRYRSQVERIMNNTGKNTIKAGEFEVKRRMMMTSRIQKKTIPSELWERYAIPNEYYTYHLKEIKK